MEMEMEMEVAETAERWRWGTWEELVLGGAVLRHGVEDWNVVASELRARTLYPYIFTPEVCKAKYEDLQERYSGSTAWFEELRKRRVAELKQELARSEDSIGSLESKIKTLESERKHLYQADYESSQTGSPLSLLNSDGTESPGKDTPTDGNSAGSFTKDNRANANWACDLHHPAADTDTKANSLVSSNQDKYLNVIKQEEVGYRQDGVVRKRRGQRKRRLCMTDAKEGSVGESENLGSSSVISTTQKEASVDDSGWTINESNKDNQNGGSCTGRRHDLMELFNSVATSESAMVFRHRMDSQKRARYRKIVRRHEDIDMIRSRIGSHIIKSEKELFRDLLLLANNALIFYSKRTREYKSAVSLRALVMKAYKQHVHGSCNKAATALLPMPPMGIPPVKPRTARPRPRKDKISAMLPNADNISPATPEGQQKASDSDSSMKVGNTGSSPFQSLLKDTDLSKKVCTTGSSPQKSLLKDTKGLKRVEKVKSGLTNPRPKTHVKERKRVRQR